MTTFTRGDTAIHWIGGGLLVHHAGRSLLLDAPVNAAESCRRALPTLDTVVLSSGRMHSVRGLLALLEARSTQHPGPLTVLSSASDERVPAIVEVWTRGWPERGQVQLDGLLPGDAIELDDLRLALLPLTRGEVGPRGVHAAPGCAVRLTTPDTSLVWLPAAGPGPVARRLCTGADLAVVEIGLQPWPSSERRWRLTTQEAIDAAQGAGELWMVGDDGRFVDPAST